MIPAAAAPEERLWLVCRPGGDVLLRWDDLTDAEAIEAVAHHERIHSRETTS
ncbi:MAG: hypothetical protein JWO56_1986 [Acidobacteria bacterium]|nr:hypothetical protein [Acidobacteriota bacterium]